MAKPKGRHCEGLVGGAGEDGGGSAASLLCVGRRGEAVRSAWRPTSRGGRAAYVREVASQVPEYS